MGRDGEQTGGGRLGSSAVRARAPASAANLGPGFDTLALALDLHVEVEVVHAARLTVRAEGEGSELPADASHLAARVAMEVAGHDRLAVTVRSSWSGAAGSAAGRACGTDPRAKHMCRAWTPCGHPVELLQYGSTGPYVRVCPSVVYCSSTLLDIR